MSEPVTLQLHSFFHLNLAYSAIEEEDRPPVIARCYWPLLRLALRPGAAPCWRSLRCFTLCTARAPLQMVGLFPPPAAPEQASLQAPRDNCPPHNSWHPLA